MGSRKSRGDYNNISCGLTLEDEFVLTRIRAKAHSLHNKERDAYLWKTVLTLVCRERAYKTVMKEVGIAVDTNLSLFDEDEAETAD
jgi:hypothetical protein